MENKRLFALTAVGLAAAIAVPTIAFGNARPDPAADANTPYVGLLTGAAEVPGPGDADGTGSFAVTFNIDDPLDATTGADVCWDLTYSGIAAPTLAHIHSGAAGTAPPLNIVVTFDPTTLGATSAAGCDEIPGTVAAGIVDDPAAFYVNVHNADFLGGAIRGQLSSGPAPAGAIHLLPTPLRAYDSRLNAGPKIQPGETRTISLSTGWQLATPTVKELALPPGATAAIITLTIAETNAPGGFLTIYSAASPQPATSSINWKAADQDVAVGTQVMVNAASQVKVTDGVNTAPTHFIIDVVGYLY